MAPEYFSRRQFPFSSATTIANVQTGVVGIPIYEETHTIERARYGAKTANKIVGSTMAGNERRDYLEWRDRCALPILLHKSLRIPAS